MVLRVVCKRDANRTSREWLGGRQHYRLDGMSFAYSTPLRNEPNRREPDSSCTEKVSPCLDLLVFR